MIGLPEETEEHIEESIALCRQIAPNWILLSTFCPYPGTRLYSKLTQQKKLDPHFYKESTVDTFYSADGVPFDGRLSTEKLKYYYDNFISLATSNPA